MTKSTRLANAVSILSFDCVHEPCHRKTAVSAGFAKCLESWRSNRALADILLWRDPRKSGLLFVFGLLVLISLHTFSFISVVAYFGKYRPHCVPTDCPLA